MSRFHYKTQFSVEFSIFPPFSVTVRSAFEIPPYGKMNDRKTTLFNKRESSVCLVARYKWIMVFQREQAFKKFYCTVYREREKNVENLFYKMFNITSIIHSACGAVSCASELGLYYWEHDTCVVCMRFTLCDTHTCQIYEKLLLVWRKSTKTIYHRTKSTYFLSIEPRFLGYERGKLYNRYFKLHSSLRGILSERFGLIIMKTIW